MEKEIFCINDKINKFKILFEKSYEVYLEIQKIIIISLNDIFFTEHLTFLENYPLIIDTIECLERCGFDLGSLYDLENIENLFKEDEKMEENKFYLISKNILKILNDPLIQKHKENKILLDKIQNENLKISKKNYEVEILSNFMIDKIHTNNIDVAIEMGCGKSYLTQRLFEYNKNLIYVGIDRQTDLIKNSSLNEKNNKKKNKNKNKKENIIKNEKAVNIIEEDLAKKNSLLYNLSIDHNFYKFYENTIKNDILKKICIDCKNDCSECKAGRNILLFGLHTCGNLASDSIKIFAKDSNKEFRSLIIISCCLHLVKEFISEKARKSSIFMNHLQKIGYDLKGNFLDETLVYEKNDENIGFPISTFIKENFEDLFFTRTVRNSAMQSFPENENKKINFDDFFYKTRFYRSLFQVFLNDFIPELSMYYGFGDVEYNDKEKGDFAKFISYLKLNLCKLKNENNKIGKKFKELNIQNYSEILIKYENIIENEKMLLEFYDKNFYKIKVLWACFLIKMKFSKIVELLVILDRVIYLLEKKVNEVELVEIFDYSKSKRNYLIFANKD